MRWKTFAIGWALALAVLLFAQRRSPLPPSSMFSRVVDLTYSAPAQIAGSRHSSSCDSSAGDRHANHHDCSPESSETRLNLPAREILGKWIPDEIEPQRLITPLAVLDVSQESASYVDYSVSVEDIARWESRHGQIPPGAVVIARTGSRFVNPSPGQILATDTKGSAVAPGFSIDAARFLVEARNVYGLGIDSPSLDAGNSRGFSVHRYIVSRRVYGLENVANLNTVPESGAFVVVAPSKIPGALAVPVRVLALAR